MASLDIQSPQGAPVQGRKANNRAALAANIAWLEGFTEEDRFVLTEADGKEHKMKAVTEGVRRFSATVKERPVVHVWENAGTLHEQEIVATRTLPEERQTSMLIYLRPSRRAPCGCPSAPLQRAWSRVLPKS